MGVGRTPPPHKPPSIPAPGVVTRSISAAAAATQPNDPDPSNRSSSLPESAVTLPATAVSSSSQPAIPPRAAAAVMSTNNAGKPQSSMLSTFPKLGVCSFSHWKTNIESYIKAIGHGRFIRATQVAPTDDDAFDIFEMNQQQVMIAIRQTVDPANFQHILSLKDPYTAMKALEKRHGVNSGLATASLITQIVNHKYDPSTKLEDYVSFVQDLHNRLSQTISESSNLKLSEQLLSLFILINLPREHFASLVQQLLGELETLKTSTVFDRLLTESQLMATESHDPSVALTAKQAVGTAKGDRTSKEPTALCSYPNHQFSMHTNAECRNQKPDVKKPARKPKPSGQHLQRSASNPSKAMSAMSAEDKIAWFDRAHAANVSTNLEEESGSDGSEEDAVVHLANAYSAAIARKINSADADVIDSGTDRDIFNDKSRFISLHPIRPIIIRSANGAEDMKALYAGPVAINTIDGGKAHQVIIEDVLYCKKVSVNLISAIRLCDNGFKMYADATKMSFIHEDGSKIYAARVANTTDLWTTVHSDVFAAMV